MPRQIVANSAAVATHHPLGALAGIEMLREGGNAVDAAECRLLVRRMGFTASNGFIVVGTLRVP